MSDSAIYGATLLIYILLIVPKFLIETAKVNLNRPEDFDDQPFSRISMAWMPGLFIIFGFDYLGFEPIPAFLLAVFAFGGLYFLICKKSQDKN